MTTKTKNQTPTQAATQADNTPAEKGPHRPARTPARTPAGPSSGKAPALVSSTPELKRWCEEAAAHPFVTVDTEFMRESTYWPKLCLIQVATRDSAIAVDPLAAGMGLGPLLTLLADGSVLKVFHAARQDMEIFHQLMKGKLPQPIFDTQVAAMVCGYGDSVAYATLVRTLAGAEIDKSSRFTDWARRPLSDQQIRYALSDVTHLVRVYDALAQRLEKNGRSSWLGEEMAVLTNPATYEQAPEDAWRRLKTRSASPAHLNVLMELAAWRERQAQERDVPRGRIVKDEQLFEIASHRPKTVEELARGRGISDNFARGRLGTELLKAVAEALKKPKTERPEPKARPQRGDSAAVDLLKVLLKQIADQEKVASKLIASSEDLQWLAELGDKAEVPALHGWRRDIFGEKALKLCRGELALRLGKKGVDLLE